MTQNGVKRFVCSLRVVGAGALLLLMATSAFAQISFIARRDYNVSNAKQIVASDYNNDGTLDLAVGSDTGFSILLGNATAADGTFLPPTSVGAGVSPVAIATGALTSPPSDNIDIVLANGNGSISALLGNGDGTFQSEELSSLPSGSVPTAIVLGDFNGDNKLDAAVAVTLTGPTYAVAILLGNGDGTFGAATTYAVGANPNSIAVGNFHSPNTAVDLVTANSSGSISVLLNKNDGTGTFQAATTTSTGTNTVASSVVIGDFNGDKKTDVAVANFSTSQFIVLLGNNNGTFGTPTPFSLGDTVGAIAVGDFDGNGTADMAILTNTFHSIAIWGGAGDGTFAPPNPPVNFDVPAGPNSLVTGKFRPLTVDDVATAFVAVGLSGGGSGGVISRFEVAKSVPLTTEGTDFNSVITDDFNLDGVPDVTSVFQLVATSGAGNMFLGPVSVHVPSQFDIASLDDPAHQVYFSTSGDFNLDGKPDLAVTADGNIELLLGNGDGTFQTPATVTTGGAPYGIASGDFNGDGIPDLIISDTNGPDLEILLGNGDGSFKTATQITLLSQGAGLAVGDLNGDGKLDVAVATNNGIEILLGNGDGTFQTPVTYGSLPFASVAIGSLNSNTDSFPDLVAAPGCGGCTTVTLFLGNGDGTFKTPTVISNVGLIPSYVVIADFDADGKADLAVVNFGWDDIVIYPGVGDGTFGTPVWYGTNGAGTVAVADFNSDGAPDLAVAAQFPLNDVISVILNSSPGTFAGAQLAPYLASFGNVGLGSTSNTANFVLTNPKNATTPLLITSLPATSGDFSQTNNCGGMVAVNGSCTITVTFKPTVFGLRTGSFTIADNAWNHSQTIQVSGMGVTLNVVPTSLAFGNATVGGGQTAPQNVTITNPGANAVGINSIALATGTQFVITSNNCPASLAAGGNCTVGVAFNPSTAGALADTLKVTDASSNVATVSLSGTGVASTTVTVAPTSLSFGNVALNTQSTAQTVTITNTGTAVLTISNITITGQFAQSQTCVGTLDPGTSCPISVTFNPTSAGAQSGSLIVTDTAPNSPQTVTLSGTGVSPTLTVLPATLSFGSIAVGGSPSASQTVTVTNTSSVSATIVNVVVGGSNAGDFSQTNTCGGPLAAGANCTASVQFAPTAAGSRTASLTVTSNAVGSPQSITMTGTGVNPTLTASPNPLAFGNYPLNIGPSAAFPITITNTSTATITISTSTLGGTNAGDFAVGSGSTCGGPLNANATCVEDVQFAPTAAGARSATLTVTYDTNNLTLVVPITGTGVTDAINLQTSGNTSQTISAGSSASYGFTMGGNGFGGSVSVTCSVSPGGLPCAVTPASPIAIVGNAQVAFTAKVTTTARSAAALRHDSNLSWAWAMGVFGLLMLPGAVRNKRAVKGALVLITFAMLLLFIGCGGGSSSSGGGGGGGGGTPTGTYTVTVQASSTGLPSADTKTVTLIVQ
jgi:FG-GAP-like repeat/Abnormal spindle-like microcephaly-assoc'd, ASPM-SPD-2-Hydin/FG-GAP repeat